MKLYLLHNGVSVRLMVITGYSVTPDDHAKEVDEAMCTIRWFFAQGTKVEVYEVTISPEATRTITKAVAFCREPTSLAPAISELLNFCIGFAERKPFDVNVNGLTVLMRQASRRVELV